MNSLHINLRDKKREANTIRPETKTKTSFQHQPSSNTHKHIYEIENHTQLTIHQTSAHRTCFLCTNLHKGYF